MLEKKLVCLEMLSEVGGAAFGPCSYDYEKFPFRLVGKALMDAGTECFDDEEKFDSKRAAFRRIVEDAGFANRTWCIQTVTRKFHAYKMVIGTHAVSTGWQGGHDMSEANLSIWKQLGTVTTLCEKLSPQQGCPWFLTFHGLSKTSYIGIHNRSPQASYYHQFLVSGFRL